MRKCESRVWLRNGNILLIILLLLILTGCNEFSQSEEQIVENNGYVSIIKQNTFDGTLKTDIYDKDMDYNTFLEFDGIIQTDDFDNDGNEDYLIKSPLANTGEAVYYIQFYGSERVLFLGAYEWGYLLSVECVDIDNNGTEELIVMGTNDHTYSVEDTSTFEIYHQNILSKYRYSTKYNRKSCHNHNLPFKGFSYGLFCKES